MGFKDNVLQILEYKGLTQSDLAVKLNKTPQNISMVLKKDSPSNNTVNEFARVLDVDPSDLLENDDLIIGNSIKNEKTGPNAYSRLFDYIHQKSLHPDDVSKILKVPYIKLYSWAMKGLPMTNSVIEALDQFEDLNVTWILTGEGNMILDPEIPPIIENMLERPAEFYKRLWEFMLIENISSSEMSKKIGHSPNTLVAGLDGRSAAYPDLALGIGKAFPQLNTVWLLTGQGDMLKGGYKALQTPKNIDFKILNQEHGNDFVILRDSKFLITTPLVSARSQDDYIKNLSDSEFIDELDLHAIVVVKLYAGVYRSFEVIGDHMANGGLYSIADGSIVTGYKYDRKLSGRAFEFAYAPTRQFVIITKDRIVVTEITGFDKKNEVMYCKNLNPAYSDTFSFPVGEIFEIYVIFAVTEYRADWLPERIYRKEYEPFED